MMLKTLIVLGLVSLATAGRFGPFQIESNTLSHAEIGKNDKTEKAERKAIKHINKKLTDEIKNKTRDWVPFEPEENPLGLLTDEELEGLAGTII